MNQHPPDVTSSWSTDVSSLTAGFRQVRDILARTGLTLDEAAENARNNALAVEIRWQDEGPDAYQWTPGDGEPWTP